VNPFFNNIKEKKRVKRKEKKRSQGKEILFFLSLSLFFLK
jgi:hypothetical protein